MSDEAENDTRIPGSLTLRGRKYFYTHFSNQERQIAIDWLNENMQTRMLVSSRTTNIVELVWWIHDNLGGRYAVVPLALMYVCWFEDEDDAVAFKLGYGQHLLPTYVAEKHV